MSDVQINPLSIVGSALGVNPEDVASIAVSNGNINLSWLCTVRDMNKRCYLKVQTGRYKNVSVNSEATVLTAMRGKIRFIPRLLAHGQALPGNARTFVITEEVPGFLGTTVIEKISLRQWALLAQELLGWLYDFQQLKIGLPNSPNAGSTYVGVYSASFSPVEATAKLIVRLMSKANSAILKEFKTYIGTAPGDQNSRYGLVHGSFAPHNVLFARNGKDSISLSGILDFEATRRGNGMFDVANFCLALLLLKQFAKAKLWLAISGKIFREKSVRAECLPYLIFLHLFRHKLHHRCNKVDVVEHSEFLRLIRSVFHK